MGKRWAAAVALVVGFALGYAGVGVLTRSPSPDGGSRTVTVYVAVDRARAESLLRAFEERTDIRVAARYAPEEDASGCDVLWNAGLVNTLRLKNEGRLATYRPPGTENLPPGAVDPDGQWTGFAAWAIQPSVLVAEEGDGRDDAASGLPGTVALGRDAAHSAEARALVDFLVSVDAEWRWNDGLVKKGTAP